MGRTALRQSTEFHESHLRDENLINNDNDNNYIYAEYVQTCT